MAASKVRCLLMCGQACGFYGAAEFGRDSDLVRLADPENLKRLKEAVGRISTDKVVLFLASELGAC
jgi:hypothetical protein